MFLHVLYTHLKFEGIRCYALPCLVYTVHICRMYVQCITTNINMYIFVYCICISVKWQPFLFMMSKYKNKSAFFSSAVFLMHGTWNVLTSTSRFQSFWIMFIWYYSSVCVCVCDTVCLGLWICIWMYEYECENVEWRHSFREMFCESVSEDRRQYYILYFFFIKILLALHHLIFGSEIGDSDFTNFKNFTTIVFLWRFDLNVLYLISVTNGDILFRNTREYISI